MGVQLGQVDHGFLDKRRKSSDSGQRSVGRTVFTCNAVGTTSTAVGANAAPGVNDSNIVRRGQRFKLFTGAGVLKEETVFTITPTGIAVAASTTITFTPLAAVATANGDLLREVSGNDYDSEDELDARLAAIDGAYFNAARLAQMSQNDKVWALRTRDDLGSI